jgi:DNA-binding response OmpR family regulator
LGLLFLKIGKGKGHMHILVIEDEPKIAGLMHQALTEDGYQVVVAHDGRRGLELARLPQFELLVLDLMLPSMDGFQIARTLRAEGNRIPMLVVTARDSKEDIVEGLNIGADDYVTKPFSFDVLLARIRAVSRRGPIASPVCYLVADMVINTSTRQVKRGPRKIPLTDHEYRLLELLARRSPAVLPRNTIMDAVWGFDAEVSANNLEAFVHLLRSKVEHRGESKLIRTIRGVGYALRAGDA